MNRTSSSLLWGVAVVATATFALQAGEPVFEITRSTIDGGGAMRSTGGEFDLSGTIGQPDAGVMTGGPFELTGGFWFGIPLGDCEDDGDVDLFDYGDFEACFSGPGTPLTPGCECFDVNRNGQVDLTDFAIAQAGFTGS